MLGRTLLAAAAMGLLAVLASVPGAAGSGNELLHNGGFEAWVGDAPDGWSVSAGTPVARVAD
ncbi:MAG: hypothetical protein IT302_07825, partial [Dehalococcoidia bacterium]|nr:hypothetical protein [Dehalococcoidia bacterium]